MHGGGGGEHYTKCIYMQNVYDVCLLRSKTSCGFCIFAIVECEVKLRIYVGQYQRRVGQNFLCGTAVLIYVFMSVHVILVSTDSLMGSTYVFEGYINQKHSI